MITYLVLWYLVGIVGCILAAHTDIKRGGDVTVSDVMLIIFVSIAGLIVFLLALSYCFKFNNKFKNKLNPFKFVVIKGHK